MRIDGVVVVQVLVDVDGRVLTAQAVSGHSLLREAATEAARQARFTPALISGQPAQVSGFITYNFNL